MCGILAIFGASLPEAVVARGALDLLTHRGPDDSGVERVHGAWLGSRRLAVLDVTQAGHQPMTDGATGVTIAFNGEVYNYVELRAELEREGRAFRSGSDTEVVLAAYLAWGTEAFRRFNGMWGLAIWDPRTQTGLVSRDRFGVKPLFLTRARGCVSVASEPKALLRLYPELRRVDEQTLYAFLAHGQLHTGPGTFYEGIEAVPPASFVTVGDEVVTHPFWSLPDGELIDATPDEIDARFQALFDSAVALRLRSDVPVGISLSGGLDSTAVLHGAMAAATDGAALGSYTSVFDSSARMREADERAWAAASAAAYPGLQRHLVEARDDDWLEILRRAAWHLDAPNYSPAIVALWSIMERAHLDGVKVMLEGQGADEYLGGYAQYAVLAVLDALRGRGSRAAALRDARRYATTHGWTTLAGWAVRELVPGSRALYAGRRGVATALDASFVARNAARVERPTPPRSLSPRLAHDLTRSVLPALLHYGDAVSSAHSIEARQPFLDYRLVELCAALPDEWKVGAGETKRVLRRYLRAAGHGAIAARADKAGFPTPVWRWLAGDGGAAARSLLGPSSRVAEYCTQDGIERLVDGTVRRPSSGAMHLYRLVSTELWLQECLA